MCPKKLHVGICGAGIGGLTAAIACREAGARVTVLEAADELVEIGAGIQMTPNVARLLQKWGVDRIIGDNLVRFEVFNLRRRDGTLVGKADPVRMEKELGHPWWVVHRAHLHAGLAAVAKEHGAEILIGCRVNKIRHANQPLNKVTVKTDQGSKYTFDLLIGADGLNSVVRGTLFPGALQRPPTRNCAYRAVVPYDLIRHERPHLRNFVAGLTMETWVGPNGYVIAYPISAGELLNMVLSHHRPEPVVSVQEVPKGETLHLLAEEYYDYDSKLRDIISLIEPGSISRWPLIETGPLDHWSNPSKNVTLMGDAAHSMVNHMAQGAATSMEDGAFLGVVLAEVVRERMSLADALDIYEAGRMPQARMKQQVSFLNGAIWMLSDEDAKSRDEAMRGEIEGLGVLTRSPNLYSDPATVLEIYGYDVHAHAAQVISEWYRGGRFDKHENKTRAVETDQESGVEKWRADKTMNWFLSKGDWRPVRLGMGEVRTGKVDSKL